MPFVLSRLSGCNLSKRSCEALSSVLRSHSCSLTHLDLSNNDLKDSGVKILSDGLKSPGCRLDTLRSGFNTEHNTSFQCLSAVVGWIELVSGCLFDGCDVLCCRLSGCLITEEGCSSLVSALQSNPSHLRLLDLSYNHPGASGQELCALVEDPHWRLDAVRLSGCNLSDRSCEALSSVLRSQSCSLTHLDLSNNDLKDSGVKILSDGLKSPGCRLDTLRSGGCLFLLVKSHAFTDSVQCLQLHSSPSSVDGCDVLCCRLSGCLITEEGCSSLVSALQSNPSHLRLLDLSYNHPGASGQELCALSPGCRLDTLSLYCHCGTKNEMYKLGMSRSDLKIRISS
uniref:NACHT LRR and PYD domain-containing protein n=1 Tax=Sphaeramia orbicularis TaxID=375764 RepID=A0A673AT61_9TELE